MNSLSCFNVNQLIFAYHHTDDAKLAAQIKHELTNRGFSPDPTTIVVDYRTVYASAYAEIANPTIQDKILSHGMGISLVS